MQLIAVEKTVHEQEITCRVDLAILTHFCEIGLFRLYYVNDVSTSKLKSTAENEADQKV